MSCSGPEQKDRTVREIETKIQSLYNQSQLCNVKASDLLHKSRLEVGFGTSASRAYYFSCRHSSRDLASAFQQCSLLSASASISTELLATRISSTFSSFGLFCLLELTSSKNGV